MKRIERIDFEDSGYAYVLVNEENEIIGWEFLMVEERR